MKTIGILGGMSWESTADYYRRLNLAIRSRLGGHHSARLVLMSVDFEEIQHLAHAGQWNEIGRTLNGFARQLEAGGADFLLLASNSMHKVAAAVTDGLRIPFLHVGDVTADAVAAAGCRRPALLGTRFTMEDPFYRERLAARRRLDAVLPSAEDQAEIHRIIFDELCQGQLLPASRERFREVIARLVARGADSVIFGCTEISLLVTPEDASVPVFDTTALHTAAAIDFALAHRP